MTTISLFLLVIKTPWLMVSFKEFNIVSSDKLYAGYPYFKTMNRRIKKYTLYMQSTKHLLRHGHTICIVIEKHYEIVALP